MEGTECTEGIVTPKLMVFVKCNIEPLYGE